MNFKDWNWHRIVRLALGSIMIYGAFIEKEMILYLIAGILIYQAIFNIKCLTSLLPNTECKK